MQRLHRFASKIKARLNSENDTVEAQVPAKTEGPTNVAERPISSIPNIVKTPDNTAVAAATISESPPSPPPPIRVPGSTVSCTRPLFTFVLRNLTPNVWYNRVVPILLRLNRLLRSSNSSFEISLDGRLIYAEEIYEEEHKEVLGWLQSFLKDTKIVTLNYAQVTLTHDVYKIRNPDLGWTKEKEEELDELVKSTIDNARRLIVLAIMEEGLGDPIEMFPKWILLNQPRQVEE